LLTLVLVSASPAATCPRWTWRDGFGLLEHHADLARLVVSMPERNVVAVEKDLAGQFAEHGLVHPVQMRRNVDLRSPTAR